MAIYSSLEVRRPVEGDTTATGQQVFLIDAYNSRLVLPVSAPPATATSTGTTGAITWDTGFLYICTGTNSWKRVAIAAW